MRHRDIHTTERPPFDELVALATRAPSVHNTQPWLWRASGAGLELFADSARQLNKADPDGRDLLLSCGAALHHLRVAAAALGWAADVRHAPDPHYPRLLASVGFSRQDVSEEATGLLTCLRQRQTDRRRFSSWPLAAEQSRSLVRAGSGWGATVTWVEDEGVRMRLLRLTAEADERQRRDPAYSAELETWVRDRRHDGVASTNVPAAGAVGDDGLVPRRFPPGTMVEDVQDRTSSPPGIVVISTSSDDALSRVRAGEALSAVWLEATRKSLAAVPLSQATEVDDTRRLLATRELGDRACPQILLCVGWPQADCPPLPHTARRPVARVLLRGD
jgi:hypothetical protein